MPKSFPCDYTGTLQAHTEARTACLTAAITQVNAGVWPVYGAYMGAVRINQKHSLIKLPYLDP